MLTGLSYIDGLITSILAGLLLSSRSWAPRVMDFWRRHFTSTPVIDQMEGHLKASGYKGYPKERRPHYYRREGGPVRGETPTYHIFTDSDVKLQEFVGCLIPPLDFGHGRRNSEGSNEDRNLELNSAWIHYLESIGRKARESATPNARRVIFFDRFLLKLFIFDDDWIFQEYSRRNAGSLNSQMAYNIVQYVSDIEKIHDTVSAFKAINCCYLDKSAVNSALYCDFGLYAFEKTTMVYHPIYKKDRDKSIAEERIYIGNSARQRRGIQFYRDQFEKVWALASRDQERQDSIILEKRDDKDYYKNPGNEYYERYAGLSAAFFAEGYYKLIVEKLKKYRQDVA